MGQAAQAAEGHHSERCHGDPRLGAFHEGCVSGCCIWLLHLAAAYYESAVHGWLLSLSLASSTEPRLSQHDGWRLVELVHQLATTGPTRSIRGIGIVSSQDASDLNASAWRWYRQNAGADADGHDTAHDTG